MKEGWKIKKLGEICKIVGGSTPKTNIPSYWIGGTHYWITPAELNGSKYISSTTRTITDAGVKSAHLQLLPAGTVLLSSRAPIGKVAITTVPMYCNQGFKNLICNDDVLYNEYAYYFLLHNTKYLNSLGTGATFKEISKKIVEQIPVPIPSFPEQQRIVEILDAEFAKIDALKANAEKSLQAAKDLFQSALKQALEPKKNWECKTVAEISENLDYKRIPVTKKDREDGIYPYYGASGIVDYVREYLFDEDLLLVSEDGANLIARSTPIAFSVSGKIWVNNHAHVLRFPTMDLQRFVEYFFANYDLSDYITGAAQPKLTQKALNSIIIEYPSDKEELAAIISRLDNLDERCKALQENYRKTIALCEDLKQALLRKAFNGEL